MAVQGFSLSVDKDELKKLLDRFDKAPMKIQKQATGVTLTAGAKVVIAAAKSKAPGCLKSTIKAVKRKTSKKFVSKLSVKAGVGTSLKELNSAAEKRVLRKAGSSQVDCLPAMWVEFGTYGRRDYKGDEPYAPATLKKKSYRSGRSDSHFWQHPVKWLPAEPFLRPAIASAGVEQAMAKRLGEYLDKKGF